MAVAVPPLLKDHERAHGARDDPLRGRRSRAPRSRAAPGISEADRLARAAVAARRRPRPRGRSPIATRPSYGAVFFELVPEAALVLGLDLGARFVRGAICDLARATCVRARTSSLRALTREAALERDRRRSRPRADRRRPASPAELVDGVGRRRARRRSTRATGTIRARDERSRDLEGRGSAATKLASGSELPVTLENDINLAAVGEQLAGSRARCRRLRLPLGRHRARRRSRRRRRAPPRPATARRARSTTPAAASARTSTRARRRRRRARARSPPRQHHVAVPPYEARDGPAAARAGDDAPLPSSPRWPAGSRSTPCRSRSPPTWTSWCSAADRRERRPHPRARVRGHLGRVVAA